MQKKNLSVQVHPDDEYATCHDGANAKTEMWYILDCNVGWHICITDLKKDITKAGISRCNQKQYNNRCT